MAHTTRTRYVNTGTDASPNEAGGNGTTNVSDPGGTDPNRAYATLNAAEASEDGDISLATGTDEDVVIICSGSKADTAVVDVVGWTTDSNCYITIKAADGDRAVASGWDNNKYHLTVAGSGIGISEDYVRIDGLQISIDPAGDAQGCILVVATNDASDIRISGCRLVSLDTDGTYYSRGVITADANTKVWNCICIGFLGSFGAGIRASTGTITLTAYNCTVYGCTQGIRQAAGTVTAINCAVLNNVDDFNGTITITKCASDDNDAESIAETGGGVDWTGDFVDGSAGDFTLLSGSGLVGTGTDNPGSGLYSDDINGDGRTSTWDIGADEYVAAGGSIVPQAMHHYKLQRRVF